MICPLEVLDDGRTNVALPNPYYISYEAPSVVPYHLEGLFYSHKLKVCQFSRNLIVINKFGSFGFFQPVFDQCVEGLHVDVVRTDRCDSPRLLYLLHKSFVEILGLAPEVLEPLSELRVVIVTLDDDVKLGVMGDSREGKVRGPNNSDAPFVATIVPVVEDVGFRMQAPLGIDLHLQALLFDKPCQRVKERLVGIGLVHDLDGLFDVLRRLLGHSSHIRTLGVAHLLYCLLH